MIKLIVIMGVCIQNHRAIPLGSQNDEHVLQLCGADGQTSLLVGLSGGPDSVALLLWLKDQEEQGRIGRLTACHVHHGIRGAAADGDGEFCKALCKDKGIPLQILYRDVPALAKKEGCSLETAGRTARYEALEEARKAAGADLIAVAHHRGDQAETVLMHLLRGSGLRGLMGMTHRNGRIIRPLLEVSRQEIMDYLNTLGESYRTDETNLLPVYRRSRIRLQVMPLLEEISPGAEAAIAGLARRLWPDGRELDRQGRLALEAARRDGGLWGEALLNQPEALRIRALMDFLQESGVQERPERDLSKVDALLGGHNGAQVQLHGKHLACMDGGILRILSQQEEEAPEESWPLVPGEILRTPYGSFESRFVYKAMFPAKGNEAYLDWDALPKDLVIRTRREGDRFYPLGAPGDKSLSDYYTDRKASSRIRNLPLLAGGNRIYWATGCTVTEVAKVTPSSKQILYIHFQEGENDG
ncbi:MAG: tRNA lysidine(34) synthetase TilS [Clostridia bacterium]|nr:tRNA lysidine(34) synthetase TilS [Clostridia bacterium]